MNGATQQGRNKVKTNKIVNFEIEKKSNNDYHILYVKNDKEKMLFGRVQTDRGKLVVIRKARKVIENKNVKGMKKFNVHLG